MFVILQIVSASQIFLIIVSGLGVIHGLFLAIFLWIYKKGSVQSNRILSALLIILSFRVGKSVFLEFTPDLDVKFIFIGLGTLMAIGPLFYLFTKSCVKPATRFQSRNLLHFIPSIVGILFGFWLTDYHMQWLPKALFAVLFIGYYLHYLIYILISYTHFSKHSKLGLSSDTHQLLRILFYGLLMIWIAYVLNLFDESVPYVVGPVLYSIVAYVISFIIIQKEYIQKIDQVKYKSTPVSDEQMDGLYEKTIHLIETKKYYREAEASLKELSQKLNVSTQVLSQVINQKSGKNFNRFINHYRIEYAKELFNSDQHMNNTIASIAFEVGFNSISSFNTAFKKETGQTPQSYRQEVMK